jgi:O-acetyl-ADP-ribose deacetylase (regulator of RNase III)
MFASTPTKISLIKDDITKIDVDIIVNAANNRLIGGSGVNGAIHKAAGPLLLNECEKLEGCETGHAKHTKAYNLNAKWIIHTVGPIWHSGLKNETEHLANCYRNSLELALKLDCKTIAFPNISTGIYKFPLKLAAQIAISEVKKFIINNNKLKEIIFVAYQQENYDIYKSLLKDFKS